MRDVVTVAATSTEGISAADIDALIHRLPEPERRRASGLRLESRRRSFVLGRILLRLTVARRTGVRPDEVVLEIEPSGRPVLAAPLNGFSVSISHSGGYVVVGVANRNIGVDVERLRQSVRFPQVAARVCSPRELRRIGRLDGQAKERAFLTVWSRKEAYGKAIGRGIAFPMRSVTVGPSGSRVSGGEGGWRVSDLDVDPAYVAAVVAQGGGWRADLTRVEPGSL
ncbi:MAG TPA: 4'-phosphopantetheinyl transferase superfamily protein [Acidothermaceae bacterium]|nr:4'-phosphopantetheinyl transferase superfamily protein [Acidothermaceae bacterium]